MVLNSVFSSPVGAGNTPLLTITSSPRRRPGSRVAKCAKLFALFSFSATNFDVATPRRVSARQPSSFLLRGKNRTKETRPPRRPCGLPEFHRLVSAGSETRDEAAQTSEPESPEPRLRNSAAQQGKRAVPNFIQAADQPSCVSPEAGLSSPTLTGNR